MAKYNKPTIIEEEFKELIIEEPEEIIEKTKEIYNCSKCNKEYLTLKSLKSHEEKCIGIDILTCPKCMKSFISRQHKSRHIKNNKCQQISVKTPEINNNNKLLNYCEENKITNDELYNLLKNYLINLYTTNKNKYDILTHKINVFIEYQKIN